MCKPQPIIDKRRETLDTQAELLEQPLLQARESAEPS